LFSQSKNPQIHTTHELWTEHINGEAVMKKIYVLGIGGTGAKCIQAAVHLHASGAYGKDVRMGVLLVDADASNGNLQSARETIHSALEAGSLLRDTNVSLFSGVLKNYGYWNPLGGYSDRVTLSDIYREAGMRAVDTGLGELYDCLVAPEEKQADLSVGFRGRPSIGSAVVSRINSTGFGQGPWPEFINDIQADCANGDKPRIHLFGSIFGGTGSSGLPTLGTLLSRQLKGVRDAVEITASVLLPYFDFDVPDDDDIYAESKNFTLNTDAALQYLARLAGESFNCIYLVGDGTKQRYERPSSGGASQNNPSSCIELIAAAAVSAATGSGYGNGAYLTVSDDSLMSWEDFPGELTSTSLKTTLRTCYAWHSNFYNELREAQRFDSKNSFTKAAPWFDRFFSLSNRTNRPDIEGEDQSKQIAAFDKWSVDFLQWFQQLCWSGTKREQLADIRDATFKTYDGLEPDISRAYLESLEKLVIGQSVAKREKWRDSIDLLKNHLADSKHRLEGTVGLINNLYEII